MSLYTAWANDDDRQDVFVNQMRGLLQPIDLAILISVHGGKGFSNDLIHGNIRELNHFADSDDLRQTLHRITSWGAGAVVIHMGADGAGYYCHGQLIVEPAIPVRQFQNTTGCGDLLSVCMMLLHGQDEIPVPDRLRLANSIVSEFIEGKRRVIPELV